MVAYVSVALSIIAVGFSAYVFVDSRRRDRRDIFLKIHELLISDDLQRGRYLLFEKIVDEASVERLSAQEYRDINRAIGTYTTLGLYLKNGYVNERDVMALWAMPIHRAWHSAQPFIAHRQRSQGAHPWTYFELLAQKAEEELTRQGIALQVMVWRKP